MLSAREKRGRSKEKPARRRLKNFLRKSICTRVKLLLTRRSSRKPVPLLAALTLK